MPQATDQALLNKLIIEWYSVAEGRAPSNGLDPFFRFVASWIAFNALYSQDGLGGRETDQIRRFCMAPNIAPRHRRLIDTDPEYKRSVTSVMERQILRTTSQWRSDDQYAMAEPLDAPPPGPRSRSDISRLSRNLKAVLLAIYRIRNNLFHGGKRPCNPRDRRLVESSYKILTTLLADQINELRTFNRSFPDY